MKTLVLLPILLATSFAASAKVKVCDQESDPANPNCRVEVTVSQSGGQCTITAIEPAEIRLKRNGKGSTKVGFALNGDVDGAAFATVPIRFFHLDGSGTRKTGALTEAATRAKFEWTSSSATPGSFDLKARHDGWTYAYSVYVVLQSGARCERDPRVVNGF